MILAEPGGLLLLLEVQLMLLLGGLDVRLICLLLLLFVRQWDLLRVHIY